MAFDDLDEGWKRTIDGAKSGKAAVKVKKVEKVYGTDGKVLKDKKGKDVVKETIVEKEKEKGWDYFDKEIQKSVDSFNNFLKWDRNYISLDWKMIKAMMWVETNPYSEYWDTCPMQIGVNGDPGIDDVTRGTYRELIIPKEYLAELSNKDVISKNADTNIRAGIAYLLYSLATYGTEDTYDKTDTKIYEYTVEKGDLGFWGIMDKLKKKGISTTMNILTGMNPSVKTLKPGSTISYRKGSVQNVIKSWRAITTPNIQKYYNRPHKLKWKDKKGKEHEKQLGDPLYSQKLDYCLTIINPKQ
ncbi:MAG TPA: hypothetical protein VF941_08950 [Clostridia bacterium]